MQTYKAVAKAGVFLNIATLTQPQGNYFASNVTIQEMTAREIDKKLEKVHVQASHQYPEDQMRRIIYKASPQPADI